MESLINNILEGGMLLDEGALNLLKNSKMSEDFIKFAGARTEKIKALSGGFPIINREKITMFLDEIGGEFEKNSALGLIPTPPLEPKEKTANEIASSVMIKNEFNEKMREKNIDSFFDYYASRYSKMKSILLQRPELSGTMSMNRFGQNSQGSEKNVSVIGIVSGVIQTKHGNTLLELEDPTGKITAFIKKGKNIGEDRVIKDEVIAVKGNFSKNYLFTDSIIFPDVPFPQKIKTVSEAVSAAFISDLHFGSKQFLFDAEKKFIEWINDSPDAKKIKYLVIAGDVVDGVGIYPNQEKDLEVKDIYQQYLLFEKFVAKIPEHIEIIISPGNHDAVRSAEPQPPIGIEFLPNIYHKKNVHLVSNPALVTVGAKENEPGIDILIYHGSSTTDIVNDIPYLRLKTMKEPQHVMKEMLKKRHIAPIYGSITLSPEQKDYFVIDSVPDIFLIGHLHSHSIENYKGITMICSSSFQGQTAFMDRVGHVANPGKISVVDLETRKHWVVDLMK